MAQIRPDPSEDQSTLSPFEEAHAALNLSPQEQYLYTNHLFNLETPGGVDNEDGSRSTLKASTFGPGPEAGDKVYMLPTVHEGKLLNADDAWNKAKEIGLDNFPSYPDRETAQARYDAMHSFMDKDTKVYQTKSKEPQHTLEPIPEGEVPPALQHHDQAEGWYNKVVNFLEAHDIAPPGLTGKDMQGQHPLVTAVHGLGLALQGLGVGGARLPSVVGKGSLGRTGVKVEQGDPLDGPDLLKNWDLIQKSANDNFRNASGSVQTEDKTFYQPSRAELEHLMNKLETEEAAKANSDSSKYDQAVDKQQQPDKEPKYFQMDPEKLKIEMQKVRDNATFNTKELHEGSDQERLDARQERIDKLKERDAPITPKRPDLKVIEGDKGKIVENPSQQPQAQHIPEVSIFPKGYHEKIPLEQRISFNGITHPGYRWEVVDRQTGEVVAGPSTNAVRANRTVDKFDNKYGGYRYMKRAVRATDMTDAETQQLQDLGIELPPQKLGGLDEISFTKNIGLNPEALKKLPLSTNIEDRRNEKLSRADRMFIEANKKNKNRED